MMNENHQRILLVTFRHVDQLLSEAERIMALDGSQSPFQEYWPDSTPTQRAELHEQILKAREAMQRILDDLKIPKNRPVSGTLWAAYNHLAFASLALIEIQARHMKGYGDLSDEEQKILDKISSELREPIDRLGNYLLKSQKRIE